VPVVAVMVVALTTTTLESGNVVDDPDGHVRKAVAGATKPVPVMVIPVPAGPLAGEMLLIVGAAATVPLTVKPFASVTETLIGDAELSAVETAAPAGVVPEKVTTGPVGGGGGGGGGGPTAVPTVIFTAVEVDGE
jgi:hypothetical protein